MEPLRVIVIGGGRLGQFHAAKLAARADVQLIGIVEPSAERREELARQGFPVFADAGRVLSEVRAAIVAAPTTLHGRIVRSLLADGIDVLVEKPIASCAAEARQMVALAKTAGRILQVGHIERFNPAYSVAEQSVSSPWLIEAVRCGPFTGRSLDVGVVLDLMIHDLDLILSLTNSFPTAITASGQALLGGEEDVAEARIEFDNGCTAVLHASRITRQPRREMKIWSNAAIAQIDFAAGRVSLTRVHPDLQAGRFRAGALPAAELRRIQPQFHDVYLPEEIVACEKRDALAAEIADFVDCVRTRRPPVVDGAAGLAALQVAEAITQAIASGEIIRPQHVPVAAPPVLPGRHSEAA
ncbi:MAG: Gfo/Idh/MocA family oxidoreductase [Thermogutta sp.]|nr:Gfo/Idh/MocA family oxidoreductase [Thermogutta sp.]